MRHAVNPVNHSISLCGEKASTFGDTLSDVTCDDCLKVIAECKRYKGHRRAVWKKEDIVAKIQELYSQGHLPTRSVLKELKLNGLYVSSTNKFGSWENAVNAAGIPLDAIHVWTKEKIITKIQDMYQQKIPLNVSNVQEVNNTLISTAYHKFGSWKLALDAAGINYNDERLNNKVDEEYVVNLFNVLLKVHGKITTTILQVENKYVYNKIIKQFKTWSNFKRYMQEKYAFEL